MIALAAALSCLLAQGEETVVLKGARILTGRGEEIPDGVIVLVGGKIKLIGRDVPVPEGARPIDVSGKTIIPGLINGGSTLGIEGPSNEDGREVTPDLRILDMVDPASRELSRARQCGITTMFVAPGNRNVIGGLAAVIRTAGASRADLTRVDGAALKAAMGAAPASGNYPPRGTQATFFARRPTTRMGVAWEFRKAFADAKEAGSGVLLRAMEGKLPLRIAASRATDIETVLKLAEEFSLTIVLEEAQEAWKLAETIAARKVPVFLRPEFGSIDGSEGGEVRFDSLRRLSEKGVRVALLPARADDPESLLGAAMLAAKHGTKREDALRAVTLTPAEILGVSDRVGSLETGKDGDLVVLSGDPLDPTTRIERVMIGGKTVFHGRTER